MDQVQGLEAVQHLAGYGKMDVTVSGTGLSEAECQFIAFVYYLIYIPLLGRELSGSWICAGEVRCVVEIALCTGVNDHKFSGLDDFVVKMVVQGFSVLGKDGGEGNAPAL